MFSIKNRVLTMVILYLNPLKKICNVSLSHSIIVKEPPIRNDEARHFPTHLQALRAYFCSVPWSHMR